MNIIFLRHAERESLGEDPNLTNNGIKQAKYLAKRLKKKRIDEFYCSDMNRAKQTADILSKKIHVIPKIEKSLNEFKAETVKENKSKWSNEEESHYNKLISFLKKLTKYSNEDKSILIVAHGITNRIILSHFLKLNLHNIIQFTQKETGLNSIYWVDKFKNWRLEFWNDNHHVPLKLRTERDKNITKTCRK